MLKEEIGRTASRIDAAQLGSSIVAGCNLVITKSKAPTTSGTKGAASRVLIGGLTNGVIFPKMLKEKLEELVGETLETLIEGLPKAQQQRLSKKSESAPSRVASAPAVAPMIQGEPVETAATSIPAMSAPSEAGTEGGPWVAQMALCHAARRLPDKETEAPAPTPTKKARLAGESSSPAVSSRACGTKPPTRDLRGPRQATSSNRVAHPEPARPGKKRGRGGASRKGDGFGS
jgi:hypothetical protein